DTTLACQVYKVEKVTRSERAFQKHNLVSLEVVRRDEKRILPAGTRVVLTSQRLGTLAGVLFEPQSEDGLTPWHLFDPLAADKDFPGIRLPKEVKLTTRAVPDKDE